ncbi:hypothetical protein BurJ1DRAFT_4732 [Burkholderiales bacterium JOSHI_001]|nr:hypothetical protein BurJ1DRAFT_4732 [Burkholderiales bacterium JOSHI_001]
MLKLVIGFIIFAAVALFILNKAGGDVDMGGEKHDVGAGAHASHDAASAASAPAAPAAPASAASQ